MQSAGSPEGRTIAAPKWWSGAREPRYCTVVNPSPLALELTTAVLVVVAVVSVALLLLIVVAPWKQVRDEPPLDPDVETRRAHR
jgi:hypothetical protein